MYFGTIIVSITVFHVVVPSGEVLIELWRFPITVGALQTGLFKALTIVGMVFLSLVAVRADLRLPGQLGELTGKIFWSFEQIMERRGDLGFRSALEKADVLLVSIYGELQGMDDAAAETADRKHTARRSSGGGLAIVTLVTAVQWLLLLVA